MKPLLNRLFTIENLKAAPVLKDISFTLNLRIFVTCPEPTDDGEFEITQGRRLPHSYVMFGDSQEVLIFDHSINEVDEKSDKSVGLEKSNEKDQVDLTQDSEEDSDSVVEIQSMKKMGGSCAKRKRCYSTSVEVVSDAETVDYNFKIPKLNEKEPEEENEPSSEAKPLRRRPFEDELPDIVQKMKKPPKRLKLNRIEDVKTLMIHSMLLWLLKNL